MSRKNWFNTLNEALESENLLHTWDCMWRSIQYGETRDYRFDNGTKYGRVVVICRDNNGMYERPIHYNA